VRPLPLLGGFFLYRLWLGYKTSVLWSPFCVLSE